MKNIIIGIIIGLFISLSTTALAVNWARDIKPLNQAIIDLKAHISFIEDRLEHGKTMRGILSGKIMVLEQECVRQL